MSIFEKYNLWFSKPFPSNSNTKTYIKKTARNPTATINPNIAPLVVDPSDFVPPVEEAVLDPVATAAPEDVAPPAAPVAAELAALAALSAPDEAAEAPDEAVEAAEEANDAWEEDAEDAPEEADDALDEAADE